MAKRQPAWDKYEAAMLMEGLIDTLENGAPRADVIARVSRDLRQMAVNRGIEIDDVFRNENGIRMRMDSMKSAYYGYNAAMPTTKLFSETADLYKNDYDSYKKLLEEAKAMAAENISVKEDFLKYLAAKVSPAQLSELYLCCLQIDDYCLKKKILTKPLFETTDLETIQTVQHELETNNVYKYGHRWGADKIITANGYYLEYIKKRNSANPDKPEIKPEPKLTAEPQSSPTGAQTEITDIDRLQKNVESDIRSDNADEIYTVDFEKLEDLTNTEPTEFIYFDENISIESTWSDLYVKVIAELMDDYPHKFTLGMSFAKNGTHRELLKKEQASAFRTSKEVPKTDCVLDLHYSTNQLFAKLKYIISLCNVDYEYVVIKYKKKETPQKREMVKKPKLPAYAMLKTEALESVKTVLKQHYAYGIKYDSIRETMRFRRYAETMGVTVPGNDEELKKYILSAGTMIDGKVYCKNDNMPRELRRIIDSIFSSGVNVVYYESLYENESEWMDANLITSPDMLKKFLQDNAEGYYFAKKFMVKGEKRSEQKAVASEIERVWGKSPTENIHTLSERLSYVPEKNIERIITRNNRFMFVADEKYLLLDRFIITESEAKNILDYVEKTCAENGFASLNNIPLGELEEENYELVQSAIYNAVYKRVLAGKYHLNGKILTMENPKLDVVTLLKQDIKGREECTFTCVSNKVIELTGATNRQYAFQALYDDKVRVNKDRFVDDRLVDFSVDKIDNALDEFIPDNFIAIREVTTFAMFPICGQSWNHYLLESFCYKYSRKYSLYVINFNDKNAGIIARNDLNKTYDEMLAVALARSNTKLSPEAAGKYLCDVGYLAKSKYLKLDEIVRRAIELREG